MAKKNEQNTSKEVLNSLDITDIVNIGKFKENISKIDSDDKLLVASQMVDSLYDYYDNQAKANEGMYNTEFQEREYLEAKTKCNIYLRFREIIFNEIENRVINLGR